MKKLFETPEMTIVYLADEDILHTSNGGYGEDEDEDDGEWA